MSHRFAYAEQCIRLREEISSGEFTPAANPRIIGQGSSATFRPYGTVALANGDTVHIGQKRLGTTADKNPRDTVIMRVAQDLQVGSVIADRCPNLLPLLPKFVGWAEEDEGSPFLVTEDASKGGSVDVWPMPASDTTIRELTVGFSEFGSFPEVFCDETLQNTTCFEADGQEKMLDLTPAPFVNKSFEIRLSYGSSGAFRELFRLAKTLKFDRNT